MNQAFAGEAINKVQQIIVETGGDPSWQDRIMSSLEQTVGPWGITGGVILTLAGGGFWLYKKKFKK